MDDISKLTARLQSLSKKGFNFDCLIETKYWTYNEFLRLTYQRFVKCNRREMMEILTWMAMSVKFPNFNAPIELVTLIACHLPMPRSDQLIFENLKLQPLELKLELPATLNTQVFHEKDLMNAQVIDIMLDKERNEEDDKSYINEIIKCINVVKKDSKGYQKYDLSNHLNINSYSGNDKLAHTKNLREYGIFVDGAILERPKIAYLTSLAMCSFRCILNTPQAVLNSLNHTFDHKIKELYVEEFKNIKSKLDLFDSNTLMNFRINMQAGSDVTKSIISHCMIHMVSGNKTTTSLDILRYLVLNHTSMAGLQLINMLITASKLLRLREPTELLKIISSSKVIDSIERLHEYFDRYFTGTLGLSGEDEIHKIVVLTTFKWAKLIDQSYYANLSLKNNLYLGFMLASLNSESIHYGQTKKAVFDTPLLPTETKERIFKDMRLLIHSSKRIDEDSNFPEDNRNIKELRKLNAEIDDEGKVVTNTAILKQPTTRPDVEYETHVKAFKMLRLGEKDDKILKIKEKESKTQHRKDDSEYFDISGI